MFKRPSETHRELTERDGWDFSLWYVISRWGRKCPQISIFNIFPEILLLVFRGPHDHRYLCHSSRLNFCLINWALCCSELDFVCTQTNLFHPVLHGNAFPVHKGITRVDMRLSSWLLCSLWLLSWLWNAWRHLGQCSHAGFILKQVFLHLLLSFFHFWNYNIITSFTPSLLPFVLPTLSRLLPLALSLKYDIYFFNCCLYVCVCVYIVLI